jgi:hypothetical protein
MVLSFVILSPNGEYFVCALDLGRLMGDPEEFVRGALKQISESSGQMI